MKTDNKYNSVSSVRAESSSLFKVDEPLNIQLVKINQSELLKAAKEKEEFEASPWYKKHLLQIVAMLMCLATVGGGVAYATTSIIIGFMSIIAICLSMLAMFRNQDRYMIVSVAMSQTDTRCQNHIGNQKCLEHQKNIR